MYGRDLGRYQDKGRIGCWYQSGTVEEDGGWMAPLLRAEFRSSPSQPESGPGNEALCKLPRMVGPILNSVSIVLRTETVVTVLGSGY